MKKINYILPGLFTMLLFLVACDDLLDHAPQDQISSPTFWKSSKDAVLELNGCYAYLDGSYSNPYDDGAADNAFCQYPWESTSTSVSAGDIDATIDVGYNSRYTGIRRFNYFLDNVDKVPDLDESTKERYKAEVRFLRAFMYLNMTVKFGPVPLLTKSYSDPVDAAVVPSEQSVVVDYILSELKEIASKLPESYSGGSGNETGRITRGAALAIKARTELYFGKYSDAANTAQSIIGMGVYSLFRKTSLSPSDIAIDYSNFITFPNEEAKEKFYKGLASYEQQFWQVNDENSEVILTAQYITNSPYKYANGLNTILLPGQWAGWSSITPTQSLVDAYWQGNGTIFTPPTREYRALHYNNGNPDSEYLKEFTNRDTRLYASILFPTCSMMLSDGVQQFVWQKGGNNCTKTGYNFRKMMDAAFPSEWDAGNDFPIVRYAEILLTYAEAKNETSGPDASIYSVLNDIRDRAGMPPVNQAVYNTKESLRQLIRTERQIELAGEGQRYYDIRRWGIAGQVMKNIYDISNDVAQSRIWENKFILMPYPQSSLDHNPNLDSFQKQKGY